MTNIPIVLAIAPAFCFRVPRQNVRAKLTTMVMRSSQIGGDKPMIVDFIVDDGGFTGNERQNRSEFPNPILPHSS